MRRNCVQLIHHSIKDQRSLVCCGLDPDIRRMPREITNMAACDEEKIGIFLRAVIDCTAEHVSAYKIQKAFFDLYRAGHDLLKDTVAYIHSHYPKIPVILDCKIGDIDNTMSAYLHNIFKVVEADGVVVNPYMGNDVIEPFAKLTEKAAVVLVKTSNPGGAVIQNVILDNGQPLWHYVLNLMVRRWNESPNLIPVLASTMNTDFEGLRKFIPDDMPVFLAGYGAQGGSGQHLGKLINSSNGGVLVNSSRGLLYPFDVTDSSWRQSVTQATCDMKNTLNQQAGLSS